MKAGRRHNAEGLTALGQFLEPYMRTQDKEWGYADLALALGLRPNSGRQAVLRLFTRPQKRFPQIDLRKLVRVLGLSDEHEQELLALTAGMSFKAVSSEATVFGRLAAESVAEPPGSHSPLLRAGIPHITHGYSGLLDKIGEAEPDLIRLLQLGDAAYVAERARRRYTEVLSEQALPPGERKRWLVRLTKLIETAQEVSGDWHGARVSQAFRAVNRLYRDFALVDDSYDRWSGFYFDEAVFFARKAALWREIYRDTAPTSVRYLHASDRCFNEALELLDMHALSRTAHLSAMGNALHFRDTILRFVLRCQLLHTRAVMGDPEWPDHIEELTMGRDALSALHSGLRDALIEYFKGQGYKRLAWAARPRNERDWTDHNRRGRQRLYLNAAGYHFDQFLASEYAHAAWRAANLDAFGVPRHDQLTAEQPSLVSDEQVRLLITTSSIEAKVWSDPDRVKRVITQRLQVDLARAYPSATVKSRNTLSLAEDLLSRR
jgi:hypothetical protein